MKSEQEKRTELLECFDDNGNIIDPQPRDVLHKKPRTTWHGIVNIWLINTDGEVLCTKRAEHIEGNPGKWQTYLGGHVEAGHSFEETARRELEEEVGIKMGEYKFSSLGRGFREDQMHYFENFAVLFNEAETKLDFADKEVSEAKWFSYELYSAEKDENPDQWCNSMKPEHYEAACNELQIKNS